MPYLSVKKIEWEFGEDYGHVFYPEGIVDLFSKIEELNLWGKAKKYPFLVILHFYDDSLYLAFTVGHKYSMMEFSYKINSESKIDSGPSYLINPQGDPEERIPIYYMSSQSMPDTTKMLPYDQVLSAVSHFLIHRKFPSFITFDHEEVNRLFVLNR